MISHSDGWTCATFIQTKWNAIQYGGTLGEKHVLFDGV
jgi:hypothetical protein